ncbi:uncharacterized protein LOC118196336 [Stegodyphus dumicola]|uniref:uncharacterized protein LOC118196336 n=1 Tax=Stegodyphus dumicola TaxID=202533 RepID=UPI0015AAFA0D|nr:uncharacterized protein LOC118196336 [Stegodyphus dumicola]
MQYAESNDHIYTSRGCLPSSTLWPSCQKLPTFAHSDGEETAFCSVAQESLNHSNSDNGQHMIPGGIGNRIGVTYIIRDGLAEMYIFFNGSVYGPCATEIPLNGDPIYAVVDLYGTTKKVRIVQIYTVPSLQIVCRDKIRQQMSRSQVFHLPLPQKLKDFIYYNS